MPLYYKSFAHTEVKEMGLQRFSPNYLKNIKSIKAVILKTRFRSISHIRLITFLLCLSFSLSQTHMHKRYLQHDLIKWVGAGTNVAQEHAETDSLKDAGNDADCKHVQGSLLLNHL